MIRMCVEVQVEVDPGAGLVRIIDSIPVPDRRCPPDECPAEYVDAVRLLCPGAALLALPATLPAARRSVVTEYLRRVETQKSDAKRRGVHLTHSELAAGVGITVRHLRYLRQQQRPPSSPPA